MCMCGCTPVSVFKVFTVLFSILVLQHGHRDRPVLADGCISTCHTSTAEELQAEKPVRFPYFVSEHVHEKRIAPSLDVEIRWLWIPYCHLLRNPAQWAEAQISKTDRILWSVAASRVNFPSEYTDKLWACFTWQLTIWPGIYKSLPSWLPTPSAQRNFCCKVFENVSCHAWKVTEWKIFSKIVRSLEGGFLQIRSHIFKLSCSRDGPWQRNVTFAVHCAWLHRFQQMDDGVEKAEADGGPEVLTF